MAFFGQQHNLYIRPKRPCDGVRRRQRQKIVEIKRRPSGDGRRSCRQWLVVIATKKGEVIALDSHDGHRLWVSALSSQVVTPAAIHAGVVVVQSVDGKLAGLSVVDGKRLWLYERSEPPLSLYGTARLFWSAISCSPVLPPQDCRDSDQGWQAPVGDAVAQPHGRNEVERLVDVDASPIVVRNVVYAASYQGKIIAVDMQTGRILWSRDVSTYTGMDADSKNIYLTDDHGIVMALDQQTGASVWKQEQLRARQLNAPRCVTDWWPSVISRVMFTGCRAMMVISWRVTESVIAPFDPGTGQ